MTGWQCVNITKRQGKLRVINFLKFTLTHIYQTLMMIYEYGIENEKWSTIIHY